jgi:hypothetical protein
VPLIGPSRSEGGNFADPLCRPIYIGLYTILRMPRTGDPVMLCMRQSGRTIQPRTLVGRRPELARSRQTITIWSGGTVNFPGDLTISDPGAIKRLLLVLFVLVTLGGMLWDRLDARKRNPTIGSGAANDGSDATNN